MRARLARVLPRSIAGQIVWLVLVGMVLFHVTMTAALTLTGSTGDEPTGPEHSPPAITDRFAEFVRLLDRLPAAGRPDVAAAMRETHPALHITLLRDRPGAAPGEPESEGRPEEKLDHLRRVLGPDLKAAVLAPDPTGPEPRRYRVAVTLRDGALVAGTVPGVGPLPQALWATALVLATATFVVLSLAGLLWWATRGLTAPLAGFAASAESFSLNQNAAPLPESGPDEVRTAARALNHMQARIRGMVEDRTRMLAAIGHDLRTPITRMRLRAEFIDDEEVRRPILRDLDQMNAMVQSALAYLRDGRAQGRATLVDLAPLLQTICHEFTDMGEDVAFSGPDHLPVRACPEELARAVTNLVENAVKYGGRATLRLAPASPTSVAVEVEDEGPGIPETEAVRMLEPFVRGDEARTMDATGGFGLGLSIARAVAEGHGGRLTLCNRHPTGLIARLELPLEEQPRHAATA